jgi:hypothetical protein
MSWGYFVDLKLTLKTTAWKKLRDAKPGDTALEPGWSGLEEPSLEKAFGRPWSEDESFVKILKGRAYHGEDTVLHIDEREGMTAVRICLMLDKSTLEQAYPLAALLYAARDAGSGSLRIVNDGTAAGEEGVEITLAKKKITKTAIEDSFVIAEELMAELYGDLVSNRLKSKSSRRVPINPFTGKPVSSKKV